MWLNSSKIKIQGNIWSNDNENSFNSVKNSPQMLFQNQWTGSGTYLILNAMLNLQGYNHIKIRLHRVKWNNAFN